MVKICEVGPDALSQYASVPISFQVRSILRVDPVENGLAGIRMVEEPANPPYLKDYDVDELPTEWAVKFNVRNWAFFLAIEGDQPPLGAAAVVWKTPGIFMLEGRSDLAVLWDIRVRPDARGMGIGPRLFHAAEDWALARGCTQLKVETQNINVAACRFYARMGCVLGGIHRHAYRDSYPNEVMLLWFKELR